MSIHVKADQPDPREKKDLEETQDVVSENNDTQDFELEDEEEMDDDDVEDAEEDDEM